jgi:hypothetical protein
MELLSNTGAHRFQNKTLAHWYILLWVKKPLWDLGMTAVLQQRQELSVVEFQLQPAAHDNYSIPNKGAHTTQCALGLVKHRQNSSSGRCIHSVDSLLR